MRLLVLFLLISLGSQAQIIRAQPFYVKSPTSTYSYLLNDYTGAYFAFSFRKLSSNYDTCIRVRRSSDNTEQDIFFINNYIDTASLKTFVGNNNGFIVRWYDQTGNLRNAINTTTSNQPQIILNGNFYYVNGKISAYLDGNRFWSLPIFTMTNNNYQSFVGKRDSVNKVLNAIGSTGSGTRYFAGITSTNYFISRSKTTSVIQSVDTTISTDQLLFTAVSNATIQQQYKNGSLISSNSSVLTISLSTNAIGRTVALGNTVGKLQEIIFYNQDNSSNRTGIESNINSYYSIW